MSLESLPLCLIDLSLISRLKKFEDDEDEESLSNMDSQCDSKLDSQLNRGSNSSENIVSMESGTEIEVFLLVTVLFLSASL